MEIILEIRQQIGVDLSANGDIMGWHSQTEQEYVCRLAQDSGMELMEQLTEFVYKTVIMAIGPIFRLACAIMSKLHAPTIPMLIL